MIATAYPNVVEHPAAAPGVRGAARLWRRIGLAVALALACIAGAAGWQAWLAQRAVLAENSLAPLNRVVEEHALRTRQLLRFAAHADGAADLARVLGDDRRAAATEERAWTVAREHAPGVEPSLQRWRSARAAVWQALEPRSASPERALGLEPSIERSELAARALLQELRARSALEREGSRRAALAGAAVTFVLLLALVAGVLVPGLRQLHRQSTRLQQQSRENRRLALIAERTGLMALLLDNERRVCWANEATTRASGYELHELLGRRVGRLLVSPRGDLTDAMQMRADLSDSRAARAQLLLRSRDGREFWVDADIQPLIGADGRRDGYLAVASDITESMSRRLHDDAVFKALPVAVLECDMHGTVRQTNAAAEAMHGLAQGERIDAWAARAPQRHDGSPLPAAEWPLQAALAQQSGRQGVVVGLTDPAGQRRWVIVHTDVLRDALGKPSGVVSCWLDVTERRRMLEQLRDSALQDPLTRMPNRRVVQERVERALAHRVRHPDYAFAVLFIDVDRFKQVNDMLGHTAGDELLCQVAARLQDTLRPGDAVARIGEADQPEPGAQPTAARLGGDEFVVVLEGTRHLEDVAVVTQRLLAVLAAPYRIGSHTVHLTASIGIVHAEQADGDAEAVLRDCDTAMGEAKRAGRNRAVVFEPEMRDRVRERVQTEADLRQAIAADELYVAYQPVVDLPGGSLAGVEALVRWRHAERGDISPAQFIPLAEECGLIDAIGDLVLHKACAQFARWQERWGARAPRTLAVNLSRAQMRQPGLVPEVLAVLEANGMQPAQLQLEVTEGFAAQDAQMQAMMRALKAAGVRLALDDFGTGYSSLACLHQLPVDTVKVDRSFVAHAHEVEYHRVLIAATIRVARALGITTVAEGVETDEQAELMCTLECDRGQGWHFGRPVRPEEIDRWIERRTEATEA